MTSSMSVFEGDARSHAPLLQQVRQQLAASQSQSLSDEPEEEEEEENEEEDLLLRCLRARAAGVSQAAEMVTRLREWRHTLLEPLPPRNTLSLSPNILLAHPDPIVYHPHKHLLAVAHVGNDKEGRPIYWERTGYIQSRFHELMEHFTVDELVQYHIQSQECFRLRMKHNSKIFNKRISDTVVVFDMNHLTMFLSFSSIEYLKKMIFIDQNYYPETLHRLFVINAPWYFSTMYTMFKPLVDKRTRDKVKVIGSNYHAALQECIDLKDIPEEYGGTYSNVPWGGPYPSSTGISESQIEQYLVDRYAPEKVHRRLRKAEIDALARASELHEERTGRRVFRGSRLARASSVERFLRPVLSHVSCFNDRDSQRLTTLKLIQVDIAHVENAPHCHFYALDIRCRNISTRKTLRRYSDFRVLMKEMKKLQATCDTDFPPRRLFKRSPHVVKQRMKALNAFLKKSLALCISSKDSEAMEVMLDFLSLEGMVDRIAATSEHALRRQHSSVSFAPEVEQVVPLRPSTSDELRTASESATDTSNDASSDVSETDNNDTDEEEEEISWWEENKGWVIYVGLLLVCFYCALNYGSVFIIFEPFGPDR